MQLTPTNNQNFKALTKEAAMHCYKKAKNKEEKLGLAFLITEAADNARYHVDINDNDEFILCTAQEVRDARAKDGTIIKRTVVKAVPDEKTYSSLTDALTRANKLISEKPVEKEINLFDYCI